MYWLSNRENNGQHLNSRVVKMLVFDIKQMKTIVYDNIKKII